MLLALKVANRVLLFGTLVISRRRSKVKAFPHHADFWSITLLHDDGRCRLQAQVHAAAEGNGAPTNSGRGTFFSTQSGGEPGRFRAPLQRQGNRSWSYPYGNLQYGTGVTAFRKLGFRDPSTRTPREACRNSKPAEPRHFRRFRQKQPTSDLRVHGTPRVVTSRLQDNGRARPARFILHVAPRPSRLRCAFRRPHSDAGHHPLWPEAAWAPLTTSTGSEALIGPKTAPAWHLGWRG